MTFVICRLDSRGTPDHAHPWFMETEYVDIAEACAIAIAECLYPANSRARTDKLGASYLAILKYEEGEFARIHKKVVLRKSSDLAWQLEGS